jgi:hypothetical protein
MLDNYLSWTDTAKAKRIGCKTSRPLTVKPLSMKPFLDNFPARRLASFFGIILVVGIQLVFLFAPHMSPDPYRRHERLALFKAWKSNPAAETKAAFDEEISLEGHHHDVFAYIAVSSFVIIDVALLYVYWRFWIRKPAA